MILGTVKCTNRWKYKVLLTWSTSRFEGSRRSSIFICAQKQKHDERLIPDTDPASKTLDSFPPDESRSYIRPYVKTSPGDHASDGGPSISKTVWKLLPAPNFLLILQLQSSITPKYQPNCRLLFQEIYSFHLCTFLPRQIILYICI